MIEENQRAPFIDDPIQWRRYAHKMTVKKAPGISGDDLDDCIQGGIERMISGGLPKVDRSAPEQKIRHYLSLWIGVGIQEARAQAASPLSGVAWYYGRRNGHDIPPDNRVRISKAFGGRIHDDDDPEGRCAATRIIESVVNKRTLDLDDSPVLDEVVRRERVELAQSILSQMSGRTRQAVLLNVIEGKTLREAGQDMGVTAERVRQLREKAIQQIRETMADHSEMTTEGECAK